LLSVQEIVNQVTVTIHHLIRVHHSLLVHGEEFVIGIASIFANIQSGM